MAGRRKATAAATVDRPGRLPVRVSLATLTGIRATSPFALAARIRNGLPYSSLEQFAARSGLAVTNVAILIDVPERTLVRRKKEGKLTASESDRLVRAARIFSQAVGLFEGDVDSARAWFERPQRALGNAAPSSAVRTDVGAREIERLIGRLEHGVVG